MLFINGLYLLESKIPEMQLIHINLRIQKYFPQEIIKFLKSPFITSLYKFSHDKENH